MGKKVLIYAVLCALFTSSVLISDVKARTRSHSKHYSGSHSYPSHHSSGGSIVSSKHPGSNTYQSHPSGSLSSHGYPPSSSLSGSSSGYPAGKPGSLSGSSGFGAHISSSSGSQLGSAPYPSSTFNTQHSGSHGYPSSKPGSLSGGGSSGYPSSSIESSKVSNLGSAYPSSSFGTNTGAGGHGYPSANPGSLSGGGSSGYPSSSIGSSKVSNMGSAYPSSSFGTNTGSGAHGYPASKPGSLSGGGSSISINSYPGGNGGSNYHPNSFGSNTHSSTWGSNSYSPGHTVVHHHHNYVYKPPTVIHYGAHGVSYPVYSGHLPMYVYEYRSSGNKYSHLLAGLALYNLGRMSSSSNTHHYHEHYIRTPGEVCSFIVQYRRSYYEEMGIDCKTITYFIYEDQPQIQPQFTQMLLPNGTLVVPNTLSQPNTINGIHIPDMNTQLNSAFGSVPRLDMTSMMQSDPLPVTDPRFSGRPAVVTPDMECFVTRRIKFSVTSMKKQVPCDLLHTYSVSSLRGSGTMIESTFIILLVGILTAVL